MNDLLLSFHGTLLNNNEQQMEELDLLPGATFDVSMKILGGKTHGGLNRVGKVKAGTPKVSFCLNEIREDANHYSLSEQVPPQEKPKKKTGRARRREQYAQRFSNKVASPNGIRLGPNSNYQPGQSAQRPLNGLLS